MSFGEKRFLFIFLADEMIRYMMITVTMQVGKTERNAGILEPLETFRSGDLP